MDAREREGCFWRSGSVHGEGLLVPLLIVVRGDNNGHKVNDELLDAGNHFLSLAYIVV